MKEYLAVYMARYVQAAEEIKRASKEHWKRLYIEAIQEGNEDMQIFAAQYLAIIAIMEE